MKLFWTLWTFCQLAWLAKRMCHRGRCFIFFYSDWQNRKSIDGRKRKSDSGKKIAFRFFAVFITTNYLFYSTVFSCSLHPECVAKICAERLKTSLVSMLASGKRFAADNWDLISNPEGKICNGFEWQQRSRLWIPRSTNTHTQTHFSPLLVFLFPSSASLNKTQTS